MHVGSEAEVAAAARQTMAKVNAAWEVLGDARRRRAYDDSLQPSVERPTVEPVWDEEPAWAAEVDTDDTRPGLRTQSVVFVPVAMLTAAMGSFIFGMMSQLVVFMALSIVLLAMAGVGFVAAPLLTMRGRTARGRARDPRS